MVNCVKKTVKTLVNEGACHSLKVSLHSSYGKNIVQINKWCLKLLLRLIYFIQ